MLELHNLTIEHQTEPIGIDCENPRFGWVLVSDHKNVRQEAYRLQIYHDEDIVYDSLKIETEQSIEVTAESFIPDKKTKYKVIVYVWDNHASEAQILGSFETGFLGSKWESQWIEPKQNPTNPSLDFTAEMEGFEIKSDRDPNRDFHEFQPAQYIRIPCLVKKGVKKARIYMTAHGVYRLEVNGKRPDDREFAPDNTSYDKVLQYQTYDVTELLNEGKNVAGIILGDGWWCGRVGATGDSCQYGGTLGVLFQAEIEYEDGSIETVTSENAVSSTGPIIFSDIFVGEKYDARKEMPGWSTSEFDDRDWKPVIPKVYSLDNLTGQYGDPVRPIKIMQPKEILHTPSGEIVLDVGQVLAGQIEITLEAQGGEIIKLEHTEVLDENGNYYNNILGVNKEQTEFYIAREGKQTYRPFFSYHGFRYVRITGWNGEPDIKDFTVYVLSSEMKDIGNFITSNEKINQLQSNIWWSQVSNTLSIPTDCPQRERAGWTGDIMAFSPTMAFNRQSDAFLTRWMKCVRAEQLPDGAVPMIVPYLKAYKSVSHIFGSETSCGWGDAVIIVPMAVYKAYGDKRILEENYDAMGKWMKYIDDRAKNHHPEEYEEWDEEHKRRSRYLWNTDFHYGDWLVPSMVLGNPDGGAMVETAFKTKGIVAPAYYAYSARSMAAVAKALGKEKDASAYQKLYEKIREAFIEEYVKDDGTIETDLQGIYVIALKNDLVSDEVRPRMIAHLRKLIEDNRGCLDTGFLSILFLMDVMCENDSRDMAYQLLYQNRCPSWLYEVEHGATTMWESWGAIGEDGSVSTYSYNHYAFGCIGEWLYREIGGLQAADPGYKKIRIAPAVDCGLTKVRVSEYTPYGMACVEWEREGESVTVNVEIPANTTAEIILPGLEKTKIGSGKYSYIIELQTFGF